MIVLTSKNYDKKSSKLDKKVRRALLNRLGLFISSPFHPLLNNHGLSGARQEQRSINITGDWRLVFELVDDKTVRLLDVDTHHNLYGK